MAPHNAWNLGAIQAKDVAPLCSSVPDLQRNMESTPPLPSLLPGCLETTGDREKQRVVIATCISESPISRVIPPTVLRGDLIREEEPSVENSESLNPLAVEPVPGEGVHSCR